jgi:hypothetical protein
MAMAAPAVAADLAATAAVEVADAGSAPYRLEIGGDPNLRFRADCRVLKSASIESKEDKFLTFVEQAPAQFDLDGDAVECVVRKLKGDGTITVMLRQGDDVQVASSTLRTRTHQLRLRSVGPWGSGGVKVLSVP